MTAGQWHGSCEHCQEHFGYVIYHCGFGDSSYAYCESCGRTAILWMWDERWPKLSNCLGQQEICLAMEPYIEPCECGGRFVKGAAPRCPHCDRTLSAVIAATYIERDAPGSKKGWRWQQNWSGCYCMVVEGRKVDNNFREIRSPASDYAPLGGSASSKEGGA
jgi:hypothetical protein